MRHVTLAVLLTLALGGCRSPEEPAAAAEEDEAIAMASSTGILRGEATYLERIAIPGAILQVQLVDNLLADDPGAVIADKAFTDLQGPPYAFSLSFDPLRVRTDGSYSLHASLRDADGRVAFVTDTRVDVDPANEEVVTFRMIRVSAEEPTAEARLEEWQCGDRRVSVVASGDALGVSVGERSLTLAPGGAARHADASGNAFEVTGDTAKLTLDGAAAIACSRVPSPTATPAPDAGG